MVAAEEGYKALAVEQSLSHETVANMCRRRPGAKHEPWKAQPEVNSAIFVQDIGGQLLIRNGHSNAQGRALRCYVVTGYKGAPDPDSEEYQDYIVYTKSDDWDLLWAHP